MNQLSYVAMAFGVLNLLLAALGLLLVFFDWSAARRRELLYLVFAEDNPGVNYFAAARRRRAQYTRLLAAFSVLALREFLSALLYASVSDPQKWEQWTTWLHSSNAPMPGDASLRLAATLQTWSFALGMLGFALLGCAFLYEPRVKSAQGGRNENAAAWSDTLSGAFLAAWAIFVALAVKGLWDEQTPLVVRDVSSWVRLGLWVLFIGLLLRRRQELTQAESRGERGVQAGLLDYNPGWLALAFGVGIVGSLVARQNPAGLPMSLCIIYIYVVAAILRSTLGDFEMMESSRHRLGRERQVVFSFLQRIGGAFTKALDLDQVLRMILESALETTEAQSGAIFLYHADTKMLDSRVVLNFFPPLHVDTPAAQSAHRTEELEAEMRAQKWKLGEGLIGEVAQSGQPRLIADAKAEGIMLGTTTDFMRNRSMLVVPLSVRDEPLGVMAVVNKTRGSFDRNDQALLQSLAAQGAISINNALLTQEVGKQERLRRELQIARDIQQRLLPDKCPIVPGFEIGARGTSATEVGGDYYDFFWVDNDHLGILIADVSGKGVHAALIVAMIRSAFRTQARGNPDVRDVLARVNDFMSQDLRRDMFITCIYGILDIPARTFSWARAGHEPIVVAHPHAPIDVLSPDGFALGVISSPEFGEMLEVNTIELHSGDKMLLFSDGLTEAMNMDGEEFGMTRILEVMQHLEDDPDGPHYLSSQNGASRGEVQAGAPSGSVPKVETAAASGTPSDDPADLQEIERAVASHVGAAPQSDDLTIVYLAAK